MAAAGVAGGDASAAGGLPAGSGLSSPISGTHAGIEQPATVRVSAAQTAGASNRRTRVTTAPSGRP